MLLVGLEMIKSSVLQIYVLETQMQMWVFQAYTVVLVRVDNLFSFNALINKHRFFKDTLYLLRR